MLPKIEYPIVEIDVHSLSRKVKFRPFLVKEEKILLIAKESKSADDVRNAVMQIVQNCALEDIDVHTLPLFDIEMIFVKLRAKSVGETVQLTFHCKNEVEGKPCDTDTDYAFNLDKVKYEFPEGHQSKVMITDTIGIKLKYPTLNEEITFKEDDDLFETVLHILFNYVEYVFDKESIFKPEEFGKDEFVQFVENLTVEKLMEIQNFFSTSPKVVLEDKMPCKKCGYEHRIYSEDLISFFI